MSETTTPTETRPATSTALRKRAKRGMIAGYVHALSTRHRDSSEQPEHNVPATRASD
jgi:hypothetical protein